MVGGPGKGAGWGAAVSTYGFPGRQDALELAVVTAAQLCLKTTEAYTPRGRTAGRVSRLSKADRRAEAPGTAQSWAEDPVRYTVTVAPHRGHVPLPSLRA